MKFIILLAMLVAGSAFANGPLTQITMSPLAITGQAFNGTSEVSAGTTFFTFLPFILQCRGVADQEQLRDDLLAYDKDVVAGLIRDAHEIQQPALKEIVFEILENKEAMREIEAAIPVGSNIDKITASLTLQLF